MGARTKIKHQPESKVRNPARLIKKRVQSGNDGVTEQSLTALGKTPSWGLHAVAKSHGSFFLSLCFSVLLNLLFQIQL